MTLGDILHPNSQIFLRPEYGRLSPDWPVIAFRLHAALKELGRDYVRGATPMSI